MDQIPPTEDSAKPGADRLLGMSAVMAHPDEWRSLLEALQRCADCDSPATCVDRGGRHFCDRHGGARVESLGHASIVHAVILRAEGKR